MMTQAEQADMALRKYVQSFCAPIWWESARQTVVNSGTMCVVKTSKALLGITNNHVLEIYERHQTEKHDIFCQLGSAPFEPRDNLIARSQHWDLATFTIPSQTLEYFGHRVFVAMQWPPEVIKQDDQVVFGGYPEVRRSVPPGPNPPSMSTDFVSFRGMPNSCSFDSISFQLDLSGVTWLPNVAEPLKSGTSLSGISGGPCFRLIPEDDRIELGGFIYEGGHELGIILARQANLVSATGQIQPAPFGTG